VKRSSWIGLGVIVGIAFAACAVPIVGDGMPRATQGKPWRPTDIVMTLRHVANESRCDGECCTVEAHWFTRVQARGAAATTEEFSAARLAECRDALGVLARLSPVRSAKVGVYEATLAIRAPANAPLSDVIRRIGLCASAGIWRIGFVVSDGAAEGVPRILETPLPEDPPHWRAPMPLVALVQIAAATIAADREFVVGEWHDAMAPDVDDVFRMPRGPRMQVRGGDALRPALRQWRREHPANGCVEEGWVAGDETTPLQAVIDAVDALRAAGFEQIVFEPPELSRRRG